MNLLFVYGTLRRGHDNVFARKLHAASEFEGPGTIAGSLFRIAHYPGLVEDGREGEVQGELWRISDFETLIAELDQYEGPDYNRVVRPVRNPDGEIVSAWVYLFVSDTSGKQRILSGNWAEDQAGCC